MTEIEDYTDEEVNRIAQTLAHGEMNTQPNGRAQIDFNALLARSGRNEYSFLDYVFGSEDSSLTGATGTRMIPISEEEFERRKEEFYDPEWSPFRIIYDEQDITESWDEWINGVPEWEIEETVLDTSYQSKYGPAVVEKAEEELDMDIDEWLVECIGGGRMFGPDNNFDEVYRPELLEMVEFVETHGLTPLLDRWDE